ncbi:MAG TPA: excisionase family DNA-binding protein [Candidatus Limnocylindrales bacterium]|nr:excisionase family DNA-binding protein [Candidatus Limnocylindrales bacterium]
MIYDPTGVNFVMNTLQAATYLGVPPSVVEDLVTTHMIPFTRVGDRTVFSKYALDQWVFAKSMENLHEDLPAVGFGGRPRP